MAKTEQSRQKKLAKKRSKEIAKRKRLAAEKNAMSSVAGQIAIAARSKISQCYVSGSILDNNLSEQDLDAGIGGVLVTRPIPDGRLVFACFLVDMYCMGVKDSFANLVTPSQFSDHLRRLRSAGDVAKCDPVVGKKLVTDSVEWAKQFGLAPHRDYERISGIWHDVDESQCTRTFQFGRDGRPCFIQGPNDSPEFARRVMDTIAGHLVEGDEKVIVWDEGIDDLRIDAVNE
ncbi:hypothetical protein NZK35_06170 [Stieleria sp. ICT_E10.1]|uniref:hypothetical protein n=1 Tax=Stieleria sedimenti TaxID=2976331 RepID=UPI002180401C|nr:hypothetical protein [Stieleria sedimenti]MCS7466261.1 hypothetical protein [Stieleria sedimenti]